MPFEVLASQKDQTLPMILNLRGDEAIAPEFTYNSDEAMAYLGIKRSRLNQISGRELRVARVRIDRYIRPVYREQDLKDYLDWTRATATHLSSSKAIEQAVENLDDRFNDLLQVFHQKLEHVSEEQKAFVREELSLLPAKFPKSKSVEISEGKSQADEQLQPLVNTDKALRLLQKRVDELSRRIELNSSSLEGVRATVAYFVPEFKELSVGQRSLRYDIDQKFTQLSAMILELTDLMGDLQQNQNEISESVGQALEALPIPSPDLTPQMKTPRRHRQKPLRGYLNS